MIVVDTSVWVEVLRSQRSAHAEAFASLIDSDDVLLPAPVRTELLGGSRPMHREALRRILTALPVAYPTDDTWKEMDQWAIRGSERGQSFGVGDLLIGVMAREAGALVWSLDADFRRMEQLALVESLRTVAAPPAFCALQAGVKLSRLISVSLLVACLVALSGTAHAQAQSAAPIPAKGWNIDLAGTGGVSPGIGVATTGFDLSGAVTFVRTTKPDEFSHRCRGLTVVLSSIYARSAPDLANPREQSVMVGPRWDSGDSDGTGFIRLVGGVRRVSGTRSEPSGQSKFTDTTPGIGIGLGVEVLHVLMELNLTMSPWSEEVPQRLTFSFGYIWSWPLRSGK